MCAAFAVAISSRAEADERTSSLSWVRLAGADSCVSTQDLARDVEERIGRAVFVSAAQADVSVEGHIERNANGPGFHAAISIRDSAGKSLGNRELQRADATCDGMRAPLALIVATMIDPDAVLRKKNPPESPPPTPAPTPAPPSPPQVIVKTETVYVPVQTPALPTPALPTPAPPPSEPHHSLIPEFDATFTVATGLLPNFNAGISGATFLELGRFATVITQITYFFGSDANAGENAHATFSLFDVGTGICPLNIRNARTQIMACAVFDVGSLLERPSGFGGPNATESSQLFLAAEIQARASFRIVGPLALVAGIGGLVPFSRDSYVFDRGSQQALLFQQSKIVGLGNLGLGVTF